MHESCKAGFAAACLAILTWTAFLTGTALASTWAGDENSPKTVVNQRTYIWLLPRFWMDGEESFAWFRIENPYLRTITVYVRCHTSERPIPGMSGPYTLRSGEVKVVDSRKYDIGGAILAHCSLKSHDRAKVQYMAQDRREQHFSEDWKSIRPEVS